MRGLDRVREAVRRARGDLTGEEIAAAIGCANEAMRCPGPGDTLLVTGLVCSTCGNHVDVNQLGLLAEAAPSFMSAAGHEPTVYRPTVVAREAADALQRVWAANQRTYGLCGHMVTIDAATAAARDLQAET